MVAGKWLTALTCSIIQPVMQLLHFSVLCERGEVVLPLSEQTEKSLRVRTFLKLHGALDYFRLTGANLLFYFPIWHLLAQNEDGSGTELGKMTVNHGKPPRISSCSNGTALLIRSRNFFFFFFSFIFNE